MKLIESGKGYSKTGCVRVCKAIEEQGVKICSEGLDVSILTPSDMARLAKEASAHSLANAIEVFTGFIQNKR